MFGCSLCWKPGPGRQEVGGWCVWPAAQRISCRLDYSTSLAEVLSFSSRPVCTRSIWRPTTRAEGTPGPAGPIMPAPGACYGVRWNGARIETETLLVMPVACHFRRHPVLPCAADRVGDRRAMRWTAGLDHVGIRYPGDTARD